MKRKEKKTELKFGAMKTIGLDEHIEFVERVAQFVAIGGGVCMLLDPQLLWQHCRRVDRSLAHHYSFDVAH